MLEVFRVVTALLLAIVVLVVLSERRAQICTRRVAWGLLLHLCLGVAFLAVPWLRGGVLAINTLVLALKRATTDAASFMFGYLAGGPLPFDETTPGASFIVAFRVLPLVVVINAIFSVLFHWGILPRIIGAIANLLQRLLGLSGPLGFGAAASIFLGIMEAPLSVKPYLNSMARSELFALLCCCMATVAGTVMVLYASVLESTVPGALGHIVVASMMNVPMALTLAHIWMPQDLHDATAQSTTPATHRAHSAVDALLQGVTEGTQIILNIAMTIVVMFALVNLCNLALEGLSDFLAAPWTLSLQGIAGCLLSPVMWLIGIPWHEARQAGELMGTKIVLNEFVSYLAMSRLPPDALSAHSKLLMLYAMCGFANVGSLGIVVGGLSTVMPSRRGELSSLAAKALVTGVLCTLITAALVGAIVKLA